jgi:hypothetical protein
MRYVTASVGHSESPPKRIGGIDGPIGHDAPSEFVVVRGEGVVGPAASQLMVNGPDDVYVERKGRIKRAG